MAANVYTLSMTKIYLNKIIIGVTDNTTDLAKASIKIEKYDTNSSAFVEFSTFELSTDPEPTASAATILPNSPFIPTDVLLIQIDDGTNKSDIVIVDFDQPYTSQKSEYALDLPLDAGDYTLNLDTVANVAFSTVPASPSFKLEAATAKPTPEGSSIALSRPNLVHFVGDILEVKVTLNPAAIDGGYQVSFSADLQ